MKSLLIPLVLMAAVAVALLTELAKELFVTEAKTRLERLPLAILRLARRRAHPDIRTWIYDEVWLPDFEYITRETQGLPITRLVQATRFALGLWRTAPAMSAPRDAYDLPDVAALTSFQADAVSALRSALAKRPDVSVLGIQGPWGSGKSTVFSMLQTPPPFVDAKQEDQYISVPFNPWLQPPGSNPIDSLEDTVRTAATEQLAATRSSFRHRASAVVRRLKPRRGRAVPSALRPLAGILQRARNADRFVVVFVDDLDRCSAGTAAAALDAIRTTVCHFPNGEIRFVLAFDADILADHLDSLVPRAIASSRTGRSFLEKLIQVELSLPICLRQRPVPPISPGSETAG
jgi:KAP-like P-loop domain-containing protein